MKCTLEFWCWGGTHHQRSQPHGIHWVGKEGHAPQKVPASRQGCEACGCTEHPPPGRTPTWPQVSSTWSLPFTGLGLHIVGAIRQCLEARIIKPETWVRVPNPTPAISSSSSLSLSSLIHKVTLIVESNHKGRREDQRRQGARHTRARTRRRSEPAEPGCAAPEPEPDRNLDFTETVFIQNLDILFIVTFLHFFFKF